MKEKFNIRTFGGQKQILNDLKQQLSNIKEGTKGLKSIYYHRNKVNELLKGIENRDEKALKQAIKYTLRGGEHAKPIDIKRDGRGVEYYQSKPHNMVSRNKPSVATNSYYDFVQNWDTIKDFLDGFGTRALQQALFGVGYVYEHLRNRLSSALGIDIGDFLMYLEQSKELYNGEYNDILGMVQMFRETQDMELNDKLHGRYGWWGIPQGGVEPILDVAYDGMLIGQYLVRKFGW